jgi:hypothetical protein
MKFNTDEGQICWSLVVQPTEPMSSEDFRKYLAYYIDNVLDITDEWQYSGYGWESSKIHDHRDILDFLPDTVYDTETYNIDVIFKIKISGEKTVWGFKFDEEMYQNLYEKGITTANFQPEMFSIISNEVKNPEVTDEAAITLEE